MPDYMLDGAPEDDAATLVVWSVDNDEDEIDLNATTKTGGWMIRMPLYKLEALALAETILDFYKGEPQ